MFSVPNAEVPVAVAHAALFLQKANELFEYIRQFQREQFQAFWFSGGQLKSKDEINAVLEAMDAASSGQSLRFFLAAKELAELILSMSPDSLGADDWYPKYQYAVSEAGEVRLI